MFSRAIARLALLVAALLGLLALGAALGSQPVQASRPIVILVSIDGWRWDYLERFAPPALGRLAAGGVRAKGLIPVFPSKTFPNHYTIVTGQYPDRHGILSNNMVDPDLPGRFALGNLETLQDTRWWGSEPLWVTVERQGQLAATMFWPGSDVEIAGDRPTYWRLFDHDLPDAARVDQVLDWLGQPEAERPTFVTLYFNTIDDAGHDAGPESEDTRLAALELDRSLARLVAGVEAAGLAARTHYLLVSDHGMAQLSADRVIVLDDYLDMSAVDLIDSAPIVAMNPRDGSADALYRALKDRHPALAVYTSGTLPERYRLRHHPRLPAVIGVADDGWHTTTRAALAKRHEFSSGDHGYDPAHRSMHGLFVATGPALRRGAVVPAFENVHIYELICRLLGVVPASNDGDPAVTASFLR